MEVQTLTRRLFTFVLALVLCAQGILPSAVPASAAEMGMAQEEAAWAMDGTADLAEGIPLGAAGMLDAADGPPETTRMSLLLIRMRLS